MNAINKSSNSALYYPTIEFQNYEWLWKAALYWDRIYKIVPRHYELDEPDNIRILESDGEIGSPIDPQQYSSKLGNTFIELYKSNKWDAAALDFNIANDEYIALHKDKVDVKLRELIIERGKGKEKRNWIYVPKDLGSFYMSYLANHIAASNNLSLVTDLSAAWTCSTYFGYDGEIQPYPTPDHHFQLATIIIKDYLPENILDISPNTILDFRKKRKTERQRFANAVSNAAEGLKKCKDPKIINDLIEDIKKEIQDSLKEYKQSADMLKVDTWGGDIKLTFPMITEAAKILCDISSVQLSILQGTSILMGVISSITSTKQKMKTLKVEYPYSYLLEMKLEVTPYNRGVNDNYYLCRQMEEFIND